MKKPILLLCAVLLALFCAIACTGCGDSEGGDTAEGRVLYVYNWGEYISDGSEDCVDLIAKFEEETGITVIYETYDSNETMYAMLESGAAKYDIIIPSDYMIQLLIQKDMLEKINTENIPNYKNIDERYLGQYYDPQNEYSIPYNVGMCGIVYNTELVSAEDAARGSMHLLWNEDTEGNLLSYRNNILTFDNARDGFGMAQALLGLDFNSNKKSDWDAAFDALVRQKKSLQGYTMDGIYGKMEGGNAAIGAYYAGDCLSMIDELETLAFYYPEEGTNIFIDALCIPKGAENISEAEEFINFLLEEENAVENAYYLYYASPNKAVQENEEYIEELSQYTDATGKTYYSLLYELPDAYVKDGALDSARVQYYQNLMATNLVDDNGNDLGISVLEYMTERWIELKLK